MEKVLEFVDAWMKSQKDFMDTWMMSQKEFMEKWVGATKQLQDTFLSMGAQQEGPLKETFNQYKSWFTAMEQSSKAFVDETGKAQELWKNTLEKQMDMSRKMVKNFSEFYNTTAPRT